MALDCVIQALKCKTLPIRRDDSLLFCELYPHSKYTLSIPSNGIDEAFIAERVLSDEVFSLIRCLFSSLFFLLDFV